MITACPLCDAMIPMNIELAIKMNENGIVCPCCEESFCPFDSDIEKAEMKIEELKNDLVINNSLNNNHRLYDDC